MYDSGHPEDVEFFISCYLQISRPLCKKTLLILDLNGKKKKTRNEEIKDEHKILK